MLKFHGTPITPAEVRNELAGKNFCVSYADTRDIHWCDEHAQTLMLDNGAFGAWTRRQPVDWPGYYVWCERWLQRLTTWAVIPDVIGGSEEENDALIAAWPFGERGAPVWHMHEDLRRLERLTWDWPLVCIGSSEQYAQIGTPAWHKRIAEAFNAVTPKSDGIPPKLHMLRGLAFADGPYPFYSADSTNVARNHAGTNGGRARRSARAMADEIDARNPARVWTPSPEQLGMAA